MGQPELLRKSPRIAARLRAAFSGTPHARNSIGPQELAPPAALYGNRYKDCDMQPTIIVFSHLRWSSVHQRPQHLLTRLADHYDIFFLEEPEQRPGAPRLEVHEAVRGVHVCRPLVPASAPGFHDDHIPVLRKLLDELVREQNLAHSILWFYSPMALPLAQRLTPRAVVYDCMDELSAFMNAPRQLQQRESALLKIADLVFTGGPSLYRSKRTRHPSVHCFPSSVDRDHYALAIDTSNDHPDQADLPRPRLGYFGVIDERVDLELIGALAAANPDWHFAMVGPVVKISETALPRHPNIHYFGQRRYDELPRFLAGWDVALLPFALNEATQFISPTKTLEYMTAERPIVSTPIRDVVEPYGDIVLIADARGFEGQCRRALTMSSAERASRSEAMRATVARTSWRATADGMRELIGEAIARKTRHGSPPVRVADEAAFSGRAAPAHPRATARHYDTIVIGAGPTGLSAAYHLGAGSLLLEKNSSVGGWCRSIEDGGYTFDYAGHIMFSKDPYVHELYRKLLGSNVHWQDREAWIYSKGVHTRYPFQGALNGLPPEVLKECIVGAIEARFGRLADSPSNPATSACGKDVAITDCCADGSFETTGSGERHRTAGAIRNEPRNFEEFIYGVWGAGVAKHFAIPYNRKLWAVPLSEMETSWLGGRVPLPNLEEMIDGALRPVPKPVGPNARFGYPLRGGFQALMDGFLPLLAGDLELNARVAAIDVRKREVTLESGARFRYTKLISTAPLPELVRMIGADVPPPVRAATARLRHVSVRCVNLGVARQNLTDKHWIYYPEDTVFHRVFVQGNASPHCNAPGGFALTCEITYSPTKPLPCDGEALIDRCIAECIDVGLFRADDRVAVRNQVDMPYAYVVYDHARKRSVETVREWLRAHHVILAGRYSEWEYYNSDHAFVAGRTAAEAARTLRAPPRAAGTLDPEPAADVV
jgi:UDP-galactopyranose mutase